MSRIEPGLLDTYTSSSTLDEIRDALDSLWQVHTRVPDLVQMRIAIAAAEIGANIIEHAGSGHAIRLRMEATVLAHAVEVVFIDDGAEARVDMAALRLPDDLAERRRGLALAQSVLGELTYRRCGTTNRWTLISEDFH